MSSLDINELSLSEYPEPKVASQKANSMKDSSPNFITDQATFYPAYTSNFTLSANQAAWEDKRESWLDISFTAGSSSNTGFNGVNGDGLCWADTPLAMIGSVSEVGLGENATTFYQEQQVNLQRARKLLMNSTYSNYEGGLKELGMYIDDTAAPANTGGYGPGLNEALSRRQEFFARQVTYSTLGATINGIVLAPGVYTGNAQIRMKYISDCRAQMGIKKFGSLLTIQFNGQNGLNFPLYVPTAGLATTGLVPYFAIGNAVNPAIRYFYKTITFNADNQLAMIAESQKVFQYETYQPAAVITNSITNNTLISLNISQGATYPKSVMFYGVPTNALTSGSSWVGPSVTTSTFNNVQVSLDTIFTTAQPFNTKFSQWQEVLENCAFYESDTIAPGISYDDWILNNVIEVNLRRLTLNLGDNPLLSRTVNLQFQRTDAAALAQVFIFIYYTKAMRFIYNAITGSTATVENSVLLLQ